MSKREMTKAQAGQEVVGEIKKAQEAKATGKRVKMTAPPAPIVKLGDVPNPLLAKKNMKRALTAAIVKTCTHTRDGKTHVDEVKAARMIRTSGILYKAGWKEDAHTNPLTQSEWTGGPYLRFVTNTAEGKVYATKHEDKVKECMPFAKALKEAVDDEMKKEKEAAKEAGKSGNHAAVEATAAAPATTATANA